MSSHLGIYLKTPTETTMLRCFLTNDYVYRALSEYLISRNLMRLGCDAVDEARDYLAKKIQSYEKSIAIQREMKDWYLNAEAPAEIRADGARECIEFISEMEDEIKECREADAELAFIYHMIIHVNTTATYIATGIDID